MPAFSIYVGGLLIGLTLVSFPASSAHLVEALNLSDRQYGSIYLSQLVFAIIGALGGGIVVRRMPIKAMYLFALLCFIISQSAFALSIRMESSLALVLLMIATGFFGFGFGFGGGPLNGLASALSQTHSNSAVTLLHMMAGLGMSTAPLLFTAVINSGQWITVPLGLSMLSAVLLLVSIPTSFSVPPAPARADSGGGPARSRYFWLMLIAAVFYALTEGIFANWAIIYVQDVKALSSQTAAASLAAFWGALTVGRLFASIALVRVPSGAMLRILLPLMAAALTIIPTIGSAPNIIFAYAFAGLACSAFIPLIIATTAEPYPHAISYIASMITAALMLGVGIGSYGIGSLRAFISLDTLYTAAVAFPVLSLIFILLAQRVSKH
ncbi:MAG: MFS transporter [Pseudomonadota bacterium]